MLPLTHAVFVHVDSCGFINIIQNGEKDSK